MKLWFDESLSPTLVQLANERGLEATCCRDRGVLGLKDGQLRRLVRRDGYVLVTDNAADFRPMYHRDAMHPGLILMPAALGRDRQRLIAATVIARIRDAATRRSEPPADYMLNTLVAIDGAGACTVRRRGTRRRPFGARGATRRR